MVKLEESPQYRKRMLVMVISIYRKTTKGLSYLSKVGRITLNTHVEELPILGESDCHSCTASVGPASGQMLQNSSFSGADLSHMLGRKWPSSESLLAYNKPHLVVWISMNIDKA